MIRVLSVVGAIALLAAAPAAAQTHPCDAPATTVEVRPGVPFALGFCHDLKDGEGNPTTVDLFKVSIDGAAPVFSGKLTAIGQANAAGLFYFETPKTIVASAGSRRIAIVANNTIAGDGPASLPLDFVSKALPPSQANKPRIVK